MPSDHTITPGPLLVDVRGACAMLSIGRRKLWELYNRGELPVIRIGRAVRFPVEGLREFVEAQSKGGAK